MKNSDLEKLIEVSPQVFVNVGAHIGMIVAWLCIWDWPRVVITSIMGMIWLTIWLGWRSYKIYIYHKTNL